MCDSHHHSTRSGGRLQDGAAHTEDHEKWTRRAFMKTLGLSAAAGTFMMGGTPMRALGSSALLAPSLQSDSDRILVLIQLDGGNDGLNTVVPLTNDVYYTRRPNLALRSSETTQLSTDLGLTRHLTGWDTLYGNGDLAIVQEVGYPNPNLSHFRSMDIWMSGGDSTLKERSGWAGRYLESTTPDYLTAPPEHPLAIQMGGASFVFRGRQHDLGMTIYSPEIFERLSQGAALYPTDGLPETPSGSEISFARTMVNNSYRYASAIEDATRRSQNQASYPDSELGANLANVARLIKGGMKTQVYMVSLGGFDTHVEQIDQHAYLLQTLSTSVNAFLQDMQASGFQDRVLTMTFSEFGRTTWENGSAGTDHGTTAPLFVIGSQANGGIFGSLPDLVNVDQYGDRPFSTDFRSVYASILGSWFGLDSTVLSGVISGTYDPLNLVQNGISVASEPDSQVPSVFRLDGAYPNPFRETVRVAFELETPGHVRLDVFDMSGRHVQDVLNRHVQAGSHHIPIDASTLPAGQYMIRVSANGKQATSSMIKQ